MEKQWLVVRIRPQWERIVYKQLQTWYSMEGWCPFKKVKRQYTDRVKLVETPVFKNYVFVLVGNYKEQVQVLKLDGVVDYVRYLGKPAVIREEEMAALKEFIDNYNNIQVISVQVGKVITIKNGIFKGQEGIVKDVFRKKVILELPALGFLLEASLDEVAA